MTIANKLTYLAGTKTALRDAINVAGGNISAPDTFRSYAKGWLRNQSATLDLQFWCERFITRRRGNMTPSAVGFNNIVTFTRASAGGVFNEFGQYVQRAVNEWRNDHDPATLTTSTSPASFDSNTATFTLPTGHAFFVGDLFRATAVSGSLWGIVTARTATSVTVYVRNSTGSGSASSWTCIKPLGILIEEQRTNLLLNSATLATQSRTVTATAHTLSFYGTGSVTLSGAATGTLVGTGASTKVSLTFTPSAGSLTLTVSGSVTSGQLETGSSPTSYIPTEASQVTRAADVCSVNTLSPWYRQSEGTLFVDCVAASGIGTSPQYVASLDDGTNSNIIAVYKSLAGLGSVISSNGATQNDSQSLPTIMPSSRGRVAIAYRAGTSARAQLGVLSSLTTAAIPLTGRLIIGNRSTGARVWGGHISSIQYYPRRLPNLELQELTA